MNSYEILQLIQIISTNDGASVPNVAKKMSWGQSQLLRALNLLGESETMGGLGLVQVRSGEPSRLFLTERGHQWLEKNHET